MKKTIVLGIHTMGHDTGACLFEDGRLLFAIETERVTRVKHDSSAQVGIDHLLASTGVQPSDVTCVAFSTNVRNAIARIHDFERIEQDILSGSTLHAASRCELFGRPIPCVVVAHEAAHAAVTCHFGGWRDRGLIMVNEGRGTFSRNSTFTYKSSKLSLVDCDGLPWFATGFAWSLIAHLIGYGWTPSAAGTIMALGAFAEADERTRSVFRETPARLHVMDRAQQIMEGDPLHCYVRERTTFDEKASVVATLQEMFTTENVTYATRWLASEGCEWLGLGGGCALNLPTNTALRRDLMSDVTIPPNCNDSGQAIGAAIYALSMCEGITPEPFDAYRCGRAVNEADIVEAAGRRGLRAQPYVSSIVTKRLAAGGVVALCQDRAELGPRALGNRSLLASANVPGMRKRVSEEIKQREWFRPLACVMRADRFHDRFGDAPESPYMLFSYDMPNGFAPEATHRDGTSRIQTLDDRSNRRLAGLLSDYEAETGHTTLINTSLNARGRAIAYTADDVFDDFLGNGVDVFVFGDFMIDMPARSQ